MNDDYVRQVLAWLRSALPLRPEVLDSAWSGHTRLPAIPPPAENPDDAGSPLRAIPPQQPSATGLAVGVLIPAPRPSSER